MEVITTQQASESLDTLIDKIIMNKEIKILQNKKGKRAVLMTLDEFYSWQESMSLLSNPACRCGAFKQVVHGNIVWS